jgi:hypothetical protein
LFRIVASTLSTDSWGDDSRPSASAPASGATVRKAATRYGQNTAGSLSRSSRVSHAAGVPDSVVATSHCVSRVVLPNPAGAETSVNAESNPRLRCSVSRGRATVMPGRRRGIWNLLSSSGPVMTAFPPEPVVRSRPRGQKVSSRYAECGCTASALEGGRASRALVMQRSSSIPAPRDQGVFVGR